MTPLAFSQDGGTVHRIPVEGTVCLSAVDYPGSGTPYLLLHGFPDNRIIYHTLIPELRKRGKRCIVFDFVGWGDSDKPGIRHYPYSAQQQVREIQAVMAFFALDAVRLVVHDMAGPPAIEFAVHHEHAIEELVLLNTYYHHTPARREPPTITLFSAPVIRAVCTPFGKLDAVFKPVFRMQMRPFFNDDRIRKTYMPLFLPQFLGKGNSKHAMFRIIRQVPGEVRRNAGSIAALNGFNKPVTVIFGSTDKYLGAELAREFAAIFPNARLHLVDRCNHYPQLEYPELVADLLVGTRESR
ncbi:MAG: alpha/beta hydrolase [Bacteroidia bacterium]|nr:alpha/beta hydrolase [Bacteroidia bacterium]